MTTPVCPSYAGYRFPAHVISHAVLLSFRVPLSLRRVGEMLAARGIIVSHESVRNAMLRSGKSPASAPKPHAEQYGKALRARESRSARAVAFAADGARRVEAA